MPKNKLVVLLKLFGIKCFGFSEFIKFFMSELIENQAEINSADNQDLDDWSEKYDITLTALSQEYYSYIDTIRQADEKANKYLVVISIFVAGFFTIIASSLTDKLILNKPVLSSMVSIYSWLFVVSVCFCIYFGFCVIRDFLESLRFIETKRLPDLNVKLKEYGASNHIQYKGQMVEFYQNIINVNHNSLAGKQSKIRSATEKTPKFVLSIFISISLLFLIKLASM